MMLLHTTGPADRVLFTRKHRVMHPGYYNNCLSFSGCFRVASGCRTDPCFSGTHHSIGDHMGAVEFALWARAAGKPTGGWGLILEPDEPGETPVQVDVGVPSGASEQPCDREWGAEHPAASSGSASYCLHIALSSRMGGEEMEAGEEIQYRGRGGEGSRETLPSSQRWPITAQLGREPPLLAVSVQTMMPSGEVRNIKSSSVVANEVQRRQFVQCWTGRRIPCVNDQHFSNSVTWIWFVGIKEQLSFLVQWI